MHYGRKTFAKSPLSPTLQPYDQNYNQNLGQRAFIAFTDAKEINEMYCKGICPKKLFCLHGGYTDPKDCTKCRCPDGLGGKLCNEVAPSASNCGQGDLRAANKFVNLAMNGASECNYRITVPEGKKLTLIVDQANFDGGAGKQAACEENFVEIKYGANLEMAGARFCPRSLNGPTEIQSSKSVYVIYKSQKNESEFSLRYKIDA
ncbi:hypothetical protein L596_030481 [Steinernema carpocapsae]|uniref:CUB domain-containing protein n=1 Tax=Steinernema carpocapsae TaxID=34508 RepID=A0A4V5ZX71_STECR|nr:hypothetical protein L596_030481 [Steinernema carpocapsae]